MSLHIDAELGKIAPNVLLPGDPRRAEAMARFLFRRDPETYNSVRNMWGFTGRVPVREDPRLLRIANAHEGDHLELSVQGGGMGIPSTAIYATELFDEYGVRTIIRIGTCGAMREDLAPGSLVLAQSASTDSNFLRLWFGETSFAPSADPDLLFNARLAAQEMGEPVHVCGTFSTDFFYNKDHPDAWKIWPRYGVDVVEMEAAMLYTLAARRRDKGCRALALLTVSDNLVTRESMTSQQREQCFGGMVKLAVAALGHRLNI